MRAKHCALSPPHSRSPRGGRREVVASHDLFGQAFGDLAVGGVAVVATVDVGVGEAIVFEEAGEEYEVGIVHGTTDVFGGEGSDPVLGPDGEDAFDGGIRRGTAEICI